MKLTIKKILFILSLGVIAVAIIMSFFRTEPQITEDPITTLPDIEMNDLLNDIKSLPIIASTDGSVFSAEKLINNIDTHILSDDFFRTSEDPETYGIYYYKNTGIIMVMLFRKPLSFTRALAEQKLLYILPYTKKEICTMNIRVLTNKYVDPRYAGFELGLSFCEDSINLE